MPARGLSIALALLFAAAAGAAAAMDVRRIETQIIMSGAINGDELAKLRKILAEPAARAVDTVVLRDSPGGDYSTSQRIAELIRERGWRTAVSGYCFSGCALMFLGGKQRHFTDDKSALQTQLAFPGIDYSDDAARQWMQRLTEGRISKGMLDRFEKLPRSDFIHFFDPGRLPRKGQTSVFLCPRDTQSGVRCKPIENTDVHREGIVTTHELVRSADRRGN